MFVDSNADDDNQHIALLHKLRPGLGNYTAIIHELQLVREELRQTKKELENLRAAQLISNEDDELEDTMEDLKAVRAELELAKKALTARNTATSSSNTTKLEDVRAAQPHPPTIHSPYSWMSEPGHYTPSNFSADDLVPASKRSARGGASGSGVRGGPSGGGTRGDAANNSSGGGEA